MKPNTLTLLFALTFTADLVAAGHDNKKPSIFRWFDDYFLMAAETVGSYMPKYENPVSEEYSDEDVAMEDYFREVASENEDLSYKDIFKNKVEDILKMDYVAEKDVSQRNDPQPRDFTTVDSKYKNLVGRIFSTQDPKRRLGKIYLAAKESRKEKKEKERKEQEEREKDERERREQEENENGGLVGDNPRKEEPNADGVGNDAADSSA